MLENIHCLESIVAIGRWQIRSHSILSKQAERNASGAEQNLSQIVRETYKWIICPVEDFVRGKPS